MQAIVISKPVVGKADHDMRRLGVYCICRFLGLVNEQEQAFKHIRHPNCLNLLWTCICTRQVVDSCASEPMVWGATRCRLANPHICNFLGLVNEHELSISDAPVV